MLNSITYFYRCDVLPDLKFFTFSVQYRNKTHSYCKMAEGTQFPLQRRNIVHYFEDVLDVTGQFVLSLHRENLISDAEKDEIMQQLTPIDKSRTCHTILIQNVTEQKMPILDKVLKENNFKTIEQMMTKKADLHLGQTIPWFRLDRTLMMTVTSSRDESIIRMNENSVDEYSSSVVNLRESNFDFIDTQPGCIHIFLHSDKPFYQELCNAEKCQLCITKCLAVENVKDTLKQGQIIRVVIKKNAYSLPLKDEKGKKLEFSKRQVLKLNRYFINGEMKNASKIFQKIVLETGKVEMKDRQATAILLDLIKDETDKVWVRLISLLQEFGNDQLANRLEKMICAECYRTTIINDIENVVVEIDTDLMEETFKGRTIPKVVLQKCISTKGELPRVERAKYFLEYVLLKGEMISAFADVLSERSRVVLNFSPCEIHGGKCEIASNDVDKEFIFQVCLNGTDNFTLIKTLKRPQEADDILSKGSKSLNYVVQKVANKGLPNGNISGSLEDEQIVSREDIVHKCGGKNGFSYLK